MTVAGLTCYDQHVNRWLAVWSRAVIVPAWRRAAAVWIGAGIGGGIVFGPTGMHPHDLTRLALGVPAVGGGLAVMWLLVFVPAARVLVRAESAAFLRSLPHARWQPRVLGAVALLALQLPWLALWVIGDGARGLAIVVGLSALIALVALWRPRVRPVRWPSWTRDRSALAGVYIRALRRRASDAIVRGVGLAILAGLVAALIVRNNELTGSSAGMLGSGVIAIVLIPGWVGALLPLVEAQRATTWLASSLGISTATRILVLALVVAGVYFAGAVVAIAAAAVGFVALFDAALVDAASLATIGWLALIALGASIGIAMIASRALVAADRDAPNAAVRVVVGAISGSALAVLCLGWLGLAGVAVLLAIGICALLTARPA